MNKTKRVVIIEDFEKPDSCWDCPMLKSMQEKLYCAILGERKGVIREYEHGFQRADCKLSEIVLDVED